MKLVYIVMNGLTHIGTEYGQPCCSAGARMSLGECIVPDATAVLSCFECMALPWLGEPDDAAFEHAGYACTLRRGGSGAWCGYVDVPLSHPIAAATGGTGVDTLVNCLNVHGGITYTGTGVDADGKPDTFRLGFDCAHSGDWSPSRPVLSEYQDIYRTIDYVREETMRLAEQLAKIAADGRLP